MENHKAISTVVDNVESVHSCNSGDMKNELRRIAKEMKKHAESKKGMYTISILMSDGLKGIDPKELNEMGFTVRTKEDIENSYNASSKKDN